MVVSPIGEDRHPYPRKAEGRLEPVVWAIDDAHLSQLSRPSRLSASDVFRRARHHRRGSREILGSSPAVLAPDHACWRCRCGPCWRQSYRIAAGVPFAGELEQHPVLGAVAGQADVVLVIDEDAVLRPGPVVAGARTAVGAASSPMSFMRPVLPSSSRRSPARRRSGSTRAPRRRRSGWRVATFSWGFLSRPMLPSTARDEPLLERRHRPSVRHGHPALAADAGGDGRGAGRRRPVRRRSDRQPAAGSGGGAAGQGGGAVGAHRHHGQSGRRAGADAAGRRRDPQPRQPHRAARNRRRGRQLGGAARAGGWAGRVHGRRRAGRLHRARPHRPAADDARGRGEHPQPVGRRRVPADDRARGLRLRARQRDGHVSRRRPAVERLGGDRGDGVGSGGAVRPRVRRAVEGPLRARRVGASRAPSRSSTARFATGGCSAARCGRWGSSPRRASTPWITT